MDLEPIHAHAQSKDIDESVRGNTAPVQTVRIEFSERTLAIIAIALSTIAACFSCFTFYQLTRSEREFKIWQLEVQNQSAILIREGLKQPTDLANGAAGNYQYQPKK